MNIERDNLTKALREIASGSRRNKTARLRECFDEVEAAKAAGASNKTIVAALEANGLFFDVNTFKNACSRILKERAFQALSNPTHAPNEKVQTKITPLVTAERKENAETPAVIRSNSSNNFQSESKKHEADKAPKVEESLGVKFSEKPKTFVHNPSPDKDDLF